MEGLMPKAITKINRRRALAVVAAVPVAAVSSVALANTGEDAELLRLWDEWKAQLNRCRWVNDAYDETTSKVMHEGHTGSLQP
jgi:hypothetical protein